MQDKLIHLHFQHKKQKYYRLRTKSVRSQKGKIMAKLTPIKAIRAKCLDCSNGQFKEVRLCPIKNCPLYEYRNGHRPIDEENIMESDTGKK